MQAAKAAKLWDGTGALVFTSSAGLYEVDDGSLCNEDCKIAERGSSERTDKWGLAKSDCAALRCSALFVTCIVA